MAFNLFGSSKTTSDTHNNIDNSYRDNSTNTNNAGAIQSGGGDITFSDQGAMDAAVDLGAGAYDVSKAALGITQGLSDGAYDLSRDTTEGAYGLSRDLVSNALKSNQSAMDLSLQTATGAIDHSLAIAGEATRSESKELMQSITKVGIALAVVFGIGMAVTGLKK